MQELVQEPSLESVLSKRIAPLAERAYQNVGQERGLAMDAVHRSEVCEQVSEILCRDLVALYGEQAVHLMRYQENNKLVHQFLEVTIGKERCVIDPTWQQFLLQEGSSQPRVLCIPKAHLERLLAAHGIPKHAYYIWLNAKEMEKVS